MVEDDPSAEAEEILKEHPVLDVLLSRTICLKPLSNFLRMFLGGEEQHP